jgi:TIR domain
VAYTTAEVRALTPIRETVEKLVPLPEGRDFFLCHAWDDRAGAAKELYDLLQSRDVSVWFSEKDIGLGTPFLREIDRGLAKSKVGIVLVTPALLRRLQGESIADKELSVLLAREQLVPVVHGTTYEALREISPLLASRNGLNTQEIRWQSSRPSWPSWSPSSFYCRGGRLAHLCIAPFPRRCPILAFFARACLSLSKGWAAMLPAQLLSVLHHPLCMPSSYPPFAYAKGGHQQLWWLLQFESQATRPAHP